MSSKQCAFAFLSAGLVLLLSLTAVNMLSSDIFTNATSIPKIHVLSFYASITLIYAASIVLWRNFSNITQQERSYHDAILDTGLIAIGKYIPGKIWGIIARGGIKEGHVVVSRKSVSVSAIEQIVIMLLGILLTTLLVLIQSSATKAILITFSMLIAAGFSTLLLRLAINKWSVDIETPPISMQKGIFMSVGYIVLWVLTSVPIIILISSEFSIDLEMLVDIVTAFTGAMLAGWVAIFSPGGVGIREAVFAAVAPTGFSWQQALYWIALHRTLYTLFDLVFGGSCVLVLARGIRRAQSDA